MDNSQTKIKSVHEREGFSAGASVHRVTFASGNEFQLELRRRVDQFFLQTGQPRRDRLQLYVKAATFLLAFMAAYALLVFVADTWWQGVPLALLLGLITGGIGFNLMHDGGHEAFSRHRLINRITAMTLDLIGGSSYIWRWKHSIIHHTYANITGQDNDIALGGLARMTPHQPHYAHQRWQHWYIWLLYGAMAIKWHFYDDFHDLLVGGVGPHRIPRPRRLDLALLVAFKLAFFGLAFGVPLLFHAWWVVAVYYGLMSLTLGIALSVVFQLAHCVEEAAFPMPVDGTERMESTWAVHQVQTTVDFCHGNKVLTWLLGGLNYQIEHHLFPRICHSNYPALSAVVKETCRDFGIPYNEHTSFRSGVASHFRWLRAMGLPPAVAA